MNIKSTHHRLSIAAVLAAGVITVAACGTDEDLRVTTPAAPAVAVAVPNVASDLATRKAEIAEQAQQAEVIGADRHLELRAAELAEAQTEVIGADRHLELRAAELAAQQAPALHWTGPR